MVMKTRLFLTVIAFMAISVTAFSQDKEAVQDKNDATRPGMGYYADQDNDGVCDNYPGNRMQAGNGRGKGNGQAAQGRRGMANGQGRGLRPSQGRGMGPGQGKGMAPGGSNYVDANNNGICDLRESNPVRQQ